MTLYQGKDDFYLTLLEDNTLMQTILDMQEDQEKLIFLNSLNLLLSSKQYKIKPNSIEL